ncbi:NAD(P)H-dependent oxidoreductase [Actinocorallia lasiicapitis]
MSDENNKTENSELRVAVIVASVRGGRHAPVVRDWFLGHAAPAYALDVIDLIDVDLPLSQPGFGEEPPAGVKAVLEEVGSRLERADAYVVITPEYNHSYPAALKNLIDWHYTQWRAKPVALVSYGAWSGGIRAAEHLRNVFAEMHAVTIRDAISIPMVPYGAFGEDGRLARDPELLDDAAKKLLDQLDWWARSLAEAREKRPYTVG